MNTFDNRLYIKIFFLLITAIFIFYIYRNVDIVNVEFFLGLLGLSSIWIITKDKGSIPKEIWLWSGVILFYWISTLVSTVVHSPLGDRASTVFSTANLSLIFILFVIALNKLKPSTDWFWYLILVGAIWAVSLSFFDAYSFGWFAGNYAEERLGETHSHPVKYAVIVNSFLVILLGAFPWALRKSKVLLFLVVAVCIILLVVAILTKSRTAWIGWPEAIVGWGIYYSFLLKKKFPSFRFFKTAVFSATFILIIGMLQVKPLSDVLEQRGYQAIDNVEKYVNRNTMMTSVGQRLASYEIAIQKIPEVFWFGIGEDEFPLFLKTESKKLAKEKFNENIAGFEYSQLHNQFLMSFLTKGIFAFLSIVIFFIFLFIFFSGAVVRNSGDTKPIAVAGLVFSVASLFAFMPETPLQNTDTMTHFFLLSSMLIVFSMSAESSKPKKEHFLNNG